MVLPLDPHRLRQQIRDACQPLPVSLAYLFGSHARGTADAESDVDIAVLVEAALSKEERFALRLRLGAELTAALGRDVDLVVLQDAPTLLQYNAVRSGHLLFAADPATQRMFERSVDVRYDDEAPLLEREAAAALDRILASAR